jgi:hypothetical protein
MLTETKQTNKQVDSVVSDAYKCLKYLYEYHLDKMLNDGGLENDWQWSQSAQVTLEDMREYLFTRKVDDGTEHSEVRRQIKELLPQSRGL